jgi:nucleoside-diphosphate-sugar epimerase
MSGFWHNRSVLVTGGASFIGSHLVDGLIARGAAVRVVDDLSSGRRENLLGALATGRADLRVADLLEPGVAQESVRDVSVMFHLAADHGGRGYVDLHQAGPASNLALDGVMFRAALRAGVQRVVNASSGCVYPNHLQADPTAEVYLSEDLVRPPYDADNIYGYAKLMSELTLAAYAREHGLKSVSCRYFTVYGPRAKENHAVLAMIARALARQDPFEVWGTGEQIRNWTYVDDIVAGTLCAAENVVDGRAVNLGSMERIRVREAAGMICGLFDHRPAFRFRPDMPTGPLNRVADNGLARRLFGWEPQVSFAEGVRRTVEWYVGVRTPQEARRVLEDGGLIARRV